MHGCERSQLFPKELYVVKKTKQHQTLQGPTGMEGAFLQPCRCNLNDFPMRSVLESCLNETKKLGIRNGPW